LTVTSRAEVAIHRSPADVYARLTDFAQWPHWGSQLVNMELTTAGPPRVGTRMRQVTKRGQRLMDTDVTITKLEPDRTLGIVSQGLVGLFTLEPAAGGTRLTATVEVQAASWGAALFYRMLLTRFLTGDLLNFKQLVEAS
jgi:uncharacterized protein YndB with AHSA1/START domain